MDSLNQLALFEQKETDGEQSAACQRAYLRGQLESAQSDEERERIMAELAALEDQSKPGAIWNGRIWASDEDVGF